MLSQISKLMKLLTVQVVKVTDGRIPVTEMVEQMVLAKDSVIHISWWSQKAKTLFALTSIQFLAKILHF